MEESTAEQEEAASGKHFDFSGPLVYRKGAFAAGPAEVPLYWIVPKVGELKQSFRVFEELNNIDAWPLSKIIQRELNRERAEREICNEYLLATGFLRFFPPLTAVLLPTGTDYLPKDAFEPKDGDGVSAVDVKIFKADPVTYKGYKSPEAIAGGIYSIPLDGVRGRILWDRTRVHAVIIDGQHRFHALRAAASHDAAFEQWNVPVLLVDLVELCARLSQSPTKVVRDLFVKINATPEQVDPARLILMNDREAVSTFAQVLVDDSELPAIEPAIPPELLDWRCEAGKHEIRESLTGILPIFHVLQATLMGGIGMESIEDRSNPARVKKWVKRLNEQLEVDDVIEEVLGHDKTLGHILDAAQAAAGAAALEEGEDEEGAIAFSYPSEVAQLIKQRFKDLFLPSFRYAYRNLAPYRETISLAKEHGVFDSKSQLHRYLRSSLARREELVRDSKELVGRVAAYRKEMLELASDSILHTVMGQKALIGVLIDRLASEDRTPSALESATREFVDEFNAMHARVCKSDNMDECLFRLGFIVRSAEHKERKGADVSERFWKGIIQRGSKDIDYGKTAVMLLKGVIRMGLRIAAGESVSAWDDHATMVRRHSKLLESFVTSPESLAEKIVKKKFAAFQQYASAE